VSKCSRYQGTISERPPRHRLLPGRQKTACIRTPVLRKGFVFPLCSGKTLNFGGGSSTWYTSRRSSDGHHVSDDHTGTMSTVAGRSARSLQRTSGNNAHGGFNHTTSLLQSSKSPSSTNSGAKCLETKRDVTFDCGQAKASSEILLRNIACARCMSMRGTEGDNVHASRSVSLEKMSAGLSSLRIYIYRGTKRELFQQ
jgi:hypothetical protein